MKGFARTILVILIIVSLFFAVFFFWGSSPNFEEWEYSRILTYPADSLVAPGDTFTVVTYNIGYLSGMNNNRAIDPDHMANARNLNIVRECIYKYNPTFIGFQEIDISSRRSFFYNQLDSLAANPGLHGYGALAINWDKKYVPYPYWPLKVHFGRILSGQALLSQFPVTLNKRIVLPKPESNPFYYNPFYLDRLIQISEVELDKDQSIVIMNVHLEAFDRKTREIQAKILAEQVLKYVDRYPLLLIGDFNSRPPYKGVDGNTEATISMMMGIPGMVSAIGEDVYTANPERYLTFNSENPYEKLDYIFYNTEFISKLEAGTIPEAGTASDHLPLYMKFILKVP